MPQRLEEQYPLYSEKIEKARKEGYSDDEIFDHIQGKIVQAMDEGYEMQEIFDYLGSPTPGFELLPEPGEQPSTEPVKPYHIQRMTPEEIAAEEAKMGPIDETTPVRNRTALEYQDPVSGGIVREDEALFQRWYKKIAKRTGLDPDPDAPEHKYDYRGSFLAGEGPDETGHWPSKFKDYDHPNRFVDGVDTITGQRVDQKPPSQPGDELATPTEIEYPQQAPGETIGAPITPGLPGAEIKQAPQRTRMDELIEMGGRLASIVTGKTPEKEAAQAQNILAVAREAGIPVEDARKNYKAIVNQIGLKVAPETAPKLIEEMAMHFMTAPVVAGLLTNPISTGIGLAAFAALDEAENFVATKVKTGSYQAFAGQRLSDLLPEDADQLSKDSIDLLTFIAKFKAFTLPGKLKGRWPEIFNKFTKDTVKTYGIPKKYYFRPSQVDAVYRRAAGQEISPELDNISKDLNITGKDLSKAIKYGLEVEVTPDQVMSVADKPYWAHIKRFFRIRPFSQESVIKGGKPTYRALQPELPPGKVEGGETTRKPPPKAEPPEAAGGQVTPPPKGPTPAGPATTIAEDLATIREVPPETRVREKLAEIKDVGGLRRRENRIRRQIEKIPDEKKKAELLKELEAKKDALTPYPDRVTEKFRELESKLEGEVLRKVKKLRRQWEKNQTLPTPAEFQEITELAQAFGGKEKVAEVYSQKTKQKVTAEEVFEPAKEGPEAAGEAIRLMERARELGVPEQTRFGPLAKLGDEQVQELIDIYEEEKPETEPEYKAPEVIEEPTEAEMEELPQEAKDLAEREVRFPDDMKVREVNEMWGDLMDTHQQIVDRNAPAIEKYKQELEDLKGERTKEATARKKEIKKAIDKLEGEAELYRALAEERFSEAQAELSERIVERAKAKGIEDEDTMLQIQDMVSEMITQRPYIESNYEDPLSKVIDDAIAEYQEEAALEETPPEETGVDIAKREEERIAKIDKTPFMKLAKQAGVTFSRIFPSEQGDIIDFHDPETGGDYSIYEKDLTLETLQEKIKTKREQLGPAPEREQRAAGEGWEGAYLTEELGQPGEVIQWYPNRENPEFEIVWDLLEDQNKEVYRLLRIEGEERIPVPNKGLDYFETVEEAEAAVKAIKAPAEKKPTKDIVNKDDLVLAEEFWKTGLTREGRRRLAEHAGWTKKEVERISGTSWNNLSPAVQNIVSRLRKEGWQPKEYIEQYDMEADNLKLFIKKLDDGKYSVGLLNTDTGDVLPTLKIFDTLPAAREYFIKQVEKYEKPAEEQKALLSEKITPDEFATQRGGKTINEWAVELLDKAGNYLDPYVKIEYAGFWEPSKTHPNGAIQINGPFTESSLNLRTDQFTPNNILTKLAWNYLTTDPKNIIEKWPQIDALTNEQKADIIYGRKGVQDVISFGEKAKETLEGEPPEALPPVEGAGEGEGVLRKPGRKGGPGRRRPVEEGAEPRPSERGAEGPVLSPKRRGPSEPGRKPKPRRVGNNYRIGEKDNLDNPGGELQRFDNNLAAIRLLKQIEGEGRKATPAEQASLVKYVGWGGLSKAFAYSYESSWRDRRNALQEALTDEEYESAKLSTPNAHFTSPKVIQLIYNAAKRFGFKGGRILEPAAGIGHFIGMMPPEMFDNSIVTAIEKDLVSARIAKQLYQDQDVRQSGYEQVKLPNNFYDLAVSNVPFGDFSVYDPEYRTLKMPIHDWYFIKSLDKVRPGGLVMFVTSRYTMDKQEKRTRQMIAEKADLLFAVRLPDSAFKGIANTEVVTDILFLRKKVKGENLKSPKWIETKEITIKEGSDEGKVFVNEYFLDNPKSILGKQSLTGSMYADNQYTVKGVLKAPEDKVIEEMVESSLDDILDQLPEDVYQDGSITEQKPPEPTPDEILGAEVDVKDGGFIVKNNIIYRREGKELKKADFGRGEVNRAKALIGVKDAVRQLIRVQLEPDIEQNRQIFKERQYDLNEKYDAFVKKYGFINLKDNWKLLEDDPDLALLQAIEKFDAKTKTATKTPFFSQRTIQRYVKPVKADSPKEALLISLNETAGIDLQRMSELTGQTEEELTNELQGLIYRDPDGEKWVTEDEYLSGDVKSKLEAAQEAAKLDPQYQKNVEALEKVQPEDIPIEDVKPRLGQTWVTKEDYVAFLHELLGYESGTWTRNDIKVDYTPNGTWLIRAKERGRAESAWSRTNYRQTQDSRNKYSMPGQKTTFELAEQAFNGRYPIIRIYDEDGKPIGTDEVATAEAKRIQEEIQNFFREWITKTPERREKMHRLYNDTYNRIRPRTYDGSHLTLPGSNPGIALRPHQKNAIWRIIQGKNNTLLEHVVGAGKTYAMIGAAMEMKRLGLVRKPMIIGYKHQVPDFQKSIYELYPAANVLVPTQEDFTPKRRKLIEAKITTGNWDLIVLSHEQFEKLPMSLEAQENYIREQMYELEWGIQELTRQGARSKDPTVKQLQKAKLRLEVKLKQLLDKKKDTGVTFEELGVDQIFVDEAQKFKNLQYTSTRSRVSGLGDPKGSQRSNDLYMKSRYLAKIREGKGVVFATATPVTNSLVEMFTVLRYLYPDSLENLGIRHFDAWAHQFGEDVTALEIEPTGKGYRMFTRFRRFVNLPELMQVYTDISDIQTQEMLKLPIPTIKGGKPEAVASESSELQKAYVNWLVERAERIRHGGVDPRDDNMLKITTEGRKAALDIRLVWDMGPDEPGSKLNKGVDNIYEIWKRTADKRLTQLVFSDLGTPQTEGFNVYEDMREKLLQKGVPKEEIAFIHDATNESAKQALFDSVVEGRVRILFGSSEKMGTGMNVQKRLIALHHMDAPWTPAMVEQREGRILRQLNDNPEVEIYRYATSGTFDAYMWQTLENKQGFLSQIKRGDIGREIEDVDGRALSYAEMKAIAAGDPLVREKIETEIRINELMVQHQAWQKRRRKFEEEAATVPQNIDGYQLEKEIVNEDIDTIKKNPIEEGKFKITLGGKDYEDRKEAGQFIIDTWKKIDAKEDLMSPPYALGNYRGIKIGLNKFRVLNDEITIEGAGKYKIPYNPMQLKMGTGETAEEEVDQLGLIRRIENKVEGFSKELERIDNAIATLREKAKLAKEEADKPFENAKELREKQSRLAELDAVLGVQDEGMAMAETDADDAESGMGNPDAPTYTAYIGGEFKKVKGQPVNIRDGFEFFTILDKSTKKYYIYEKDTGLSLGNGRTIKAAIQDAKDKTAHVSDEELKQKIDEVLADQKNTGRRTDFETSKYSDEDIKSELVTAWGSEEAAWQAVLDAAKRVEQKSAKIRHRTFNESLKEYRSKTAKELLLKRRVDLTGKRISPGYQGAADLAELVQVYRSPEMELLHVIYTDKKGYVLAHNVTSSGSPNYVSMYPYSKTVYDIQRRAKKLGADKIHLIHNHPNGNPVLSSGDLAMDLELSSKEAFGDKMGVLMVIDHGKFSAKYPVRPGKREIADGRFRVIKGSGRWMEREKGFRATYLKDIASFVADEKAPGRSIVLFVSIDNIAYGWTSVSDKSLLRDPEKVKEMIKAQAKAHDTEKAIIYTTNGEIRNIALKNRVGDWLKNIVFENDKGDIASLREIVPHNFEEDPVLAQLAQKKTFTFFASRREPFENLTPEQEEALERAKEYVVRLQDEAARAGLRFNRTYLRQKGFDRKSITQLMRIARLIRTQTERVGTPADNADKVMKMHLETDRALHDLTKFQAKRLLRTLKRGLVDVSGNIKPELMKYGQQGKAAVINHDLIAGSNSWAEVLHQEATEKIYGKGEWNREISSDEYKILNYLIQSRRTVAIDSYKEGVKHPRRLTGEHHEDFLDYENFREAYRRNTGKEISEGVFNELKERAQKYFDVMNEQLTQLFQNGLINEPSYEALLQIGVYEPRRFIQHIDPEDSYTFGGGRTISVRNSGIKKLRTGSFEVMENDSSKLLYQVIARTQGRIARNKANLSLWDLATNVPDNGLVRKARIYGVTEAGAPRFEKPPAGYEAIDLMVEGKKRRIFMPNEWAKEWVMRDPSIDDQVANVIGWISGAKILRPMATGMFAPEFAITNLARDAAHLWLVTDAFSRWLPVAGLQYGKALKAVWKDALYRQGLWREYMKEGGGVSFLSTQGKIGTSTSGKFLEGLDYYGTYLGNFSEVLNRLAIMQQEIWNGKSPREAAWVARNYIDFYQGGRWIKMADAGIPYLSAGIQGTRGIFRSMQNDPKSFTIKLGQLFALAIGLYLANRFINPECEQAISDSDKVRYWNITTPLKFTDKEGNTRHLYFVIAKDQGQRFFAQIAEQMTKAMTGDSVDPDMIEMAFRDFWPVMAPQDLLPPTVDALLGYSTNKDFWLNKDIWNSKYYTVGKIEPREEYYRYTHPALVKIGQALNLSPVRLGYALEQLFTYGNVFTSLVGGGLRQMFNEMPGNEEDRVAAEIITQMPGIRRMARLTRPVPDVVMKEQKEALRNEYTKRIRQNREVKDWAEQYFSMKKEGRDADAESPLQNATTFIEKQPKADQERLKKLFKEYPKYDDLPDRGWWLSLREMPPEAKAYVWFSRYRRASDSKKEELDRIRKKMPGMTSDRFMAELRKLQDMDKGNK